MKIAFAAIVKGDNSEVVSLSRLLGDISPAVNGIFITVTYDKRKDKGFKRVVDIAKMYRAEVSEFKWVDDFSAARNFNFSQVPKEYDYIFWADSDDRIRGIENLRRVIEDNPQADAFVMNYLYAFDKERNPIVVHPKTQVIRNDGSFTWSGRIHEDFDVNRGVKSFLIEGVERLHMTTAKRVEDSSERNLRIAERQVVDEPEDPRSHWNLANALKAVGREEEALSAFGVFLKDSQSEDEKYVARLRRAESYWNLGKKELAVDEARYALGTKPYYPDAYHMLGRFYLDTQRYESAVEVFKMGLVMKAPVHTIVVHNPRDYDYIPLMNLAKAYFALHFPTLALDLLRQCLKIYPKDESLKKLVKTMEKESRQFERVVKLIKRLGRIKDDDELRKEMDKIPDEDKAHPGVCSLRNNRFVKTESSGRDLVYYCGYTEKEWDPVVARTKGVGGSEEAVIYLAELWAKMGWNVTVYNACGYKEKKFGNVTYKPFWMWNKSDKQDVTVVWRHPHIADFELNTKKLYIDLHDTVKPGEFTEKRLAKIDKIFVKSDWHRSLYSDIPDDMFLVIPNGIDAKEFEDDLERDQYLMINTSSSDRSMEAMLDMLPKIQERVPEVKLKWAYGWQVFDVVHGDDLKVMEWKAKMIRKMDELKNFEALGMISHPEVNKLYLQANILFYPTEFGEIDCISITKALAGGAIPATSDFAAIGEKAGHIGYFVRSDKTKDNWSKPYQFSYSLEDPKKQQELIDFVVDTLKNPPGEEERESVRSWARSAYDWRVIANLWDNEFRDASTD